MHALIVNSTVVTYPYSVAQLRRDNPSVLFAAEMTDEMLAEWNVYPVAAITPPAHNALTQNLVELAPVFVGGGWEQNWTVAPASAAEIAERQQVLQDDIVAQTQDRLDDFARTRNYDGILSACTYATSSVPKFAAEGQYCVQSRDATWSSLYTMLAEVQAGTRPMPSGYGDIEPELPVLTWPV